MADVEILEALDSPEESNVEQKETVAPQAEEVKSAPEQQPEETAPPAEETLDVDGQLLTKAQIKEALDAAKNRTEWQKSNTQKAQEIAEERRKLEEERQTLLLGKEVSERLRLRPDLAQMIFTPEPVRDFNNDYRQLMQERPADPYSPEYVQWEMKRDQLNREIAKSEVIRETQVSVAKAQAEAQNRETEKEAIAKYVEKEKVNRDEFVQMVNWIGENFQAKNGVYPKNCFDVAYRVLYSDREAANAKIETAKQVAKSIEKAKPASQSAGMTKSPETDIDESDGLLADEFVKEVRARMKK